MMVTRYHRQVLSRYYFTCLQLIVVTRLGAMTSEASPCLHMHEGSFQLQSALPLQMVFQQHTFSKRA
jgi:hypothetical protein